MKPTSADRDTPEPLGSHLDPTPRRNEWARLAKWYGGFAALAGGFALSTRFQSGEWHEWGFGVAYGTRVGLFLAAAYGVVLILRVMLLEARSGAELVDKLKRTLWNRRFVERSVGAPVLLSALLVMLSAYATWKPGVLGFREGTYDELFATIDRIVHFGDPSTWTHAILPGSIPLLDRVYAAWYSILLATVLVMAIARPERERARFFWALGLLYVLGGTVLAHLLVSGGPVYYHDLVGTGDFIWLVEILEGTQASILQERLWSAYSDPEYRMAWAGISAMPSLHVGVATLLTLWGWSVNRVLGGCWLMYAALIMVGSVHLGWHYAIDGYMGAAIAWAVWRLAGHIVGNGVMEAEGVPQPGT